MDPIGEYHAPKSMHMHSFVGQSMVPFFEQAFDPTHTAQDLKPIWLTDHGDTSSCLDITPDGTDDTFYDKSEYWTPALLSTLPHPAQYFQPTKTLIYYRDAGVDPDTIQPFPDGLSMIAGHQDGTNQPWEVEWSCVAGKDDDGTHHEVGFGETIPQVCPQTSDGSTAYTGPDATKNYSLRLVVYFPDCIDPNKHDSPPTLVSGISPLIEHYDGHTWTKVHFVMPPEQSLLYGIVAIKPDDAWAVGGGTTSAIVEHWDGHRWSQARKGMGPNDGMVDLDSIAAIASDDVWVAGLRYRSASPHLARSTGPLAVTFDTAVFHWDGHRWTRLDTPSTKRPRNWLLGIAARSDHDVWVVGGSGGPYTYVPRHTLTEHYDGHKWSIVRSPDTGRATNVLNGVTIGPGGDAWAVGQASSDHNVHYHDLALHWDGHRWLNQPVRPRHEPPGS